MGKGTDEAKRLRAILVAEREARGWSFEKLARGVGKELGKTITRQSVYEWEKFQAQPKIDQLAAWARALGFRLWVELLRSETTVPVHVPADIADAVRLFAVLKEDDRKRVVDMIERLAS